MIEKLWFDIADFETRERKNDPDNLPRENARMEAYEKLQDKLLDEQLQNPCFHCETLVMCGDKDTVLPAEFEHSFEVMGIKGKMPVCSKCYSEIMEILEEDER